MGEWESGRMRKWENGKMGPFDGLRDLLLLFEPTGVEGVVVGYSFDFAFDVGLGDVFHFFRWNACEY